MGFLKKLFAALIGFVAVLLLVGIFIPSTWEVTRTATIAAPPSTIYPFFSDMKAGWPQWSAFDTEDPEISYTYGEVTSGEGAEREWKSKKMGDGKMKIVKAEADKNLEYKIEMAENKDMLIKGLIQLEQEGENTKITWTGTGDVGGNIVYKYTAMAMDKLMGPMLEKSLSTLKTKVESSTVK